jgi:hypothetical protein
LSSMGIFSNRTGSVVGFIGVLYIDFYMLQCIHTILTQLMRMILIWRTKNQVLRLRVSG